MVVDILRRNAMPLEGRRGLLGMIIPAIRDLVTVDAKDNDCISATPQVCTLFLLCTSNYELLELEKVVVR
jgi:hypothetical protein